MFAQAKWKSVNADLAVEDWDAILASHDVNAAAAELTNTIMHLVRRHIPSRRICFQKWSHPWMDRRCLLAIAEKYRAHGTDCYARRRDECTRVLREAYFSHVQQTRKDLAAMKRGSKKWWKVAQSLMMKAQSVSSIPPLKRADGSWARDSVAKAEMLSSTFAAKSSLPPVADNEFTRGPLLVKDLPGVSICFSADDALKVLSTLDQSSGTGPDAMAACVLERCAKVLASPVARLCTLMLQCGCWPRGWRLHWVHPIHKRKSKAESSNYRGVHLTSQLSKACERIIDKPLRRYIDFGPGQFAYTPGRGHRDALIFNLLLWLRWLEDGNIVVLYCSDVSGAFDRVCKERLSRKIRSIDIPQCLARFLESWLDDRQSVVVVEGAMSMIHPLTDSVFQGTVLGPLLWNLHFNDARHPCNRLSYVDTTYADDMNMSRNFPRTAQPASVQASLLECQRALHRWGFGNRVSFDPSKEGFYVIDRWNPSNFTFKILGVLFDGKLSMHAAVREVAVQAGWRVKALLRVQRFFSTWELVMLFKAQVLSYIESGVVAFFHAPATTMAPVDRLLLRFLRAIGLSEEDAALQYNLMPLQTRRHLSALGLLHRRVLGKAPAPIEELLPFAPAGRLVLLTRLTSHLHDKQIEDPIKGRETEMFKRSLYDFIAIYNRLPQSIIDCTSVKAFQSKLAAAFRNCVRLGTHDWRNIFHYNKRTSDIIAFQRLLAH